MPGCYTPFMFESHALTFLEDGAITHFPLISRDQWHQVGSETTFFEIIGHCKLATILDDCL